MKTTDVVIVSMARTPFGSFLGSLSDVAAPNLAATAIKGALERAGLKGEDISEVYLGNVLQAGVGQAPAKQAALAAGIPNTVPCTTINKVCSSGMKSIMMAAQAIQLGDADIVVAGGMENMSLAPHYLHARKGTKFGPAQMEDGMQKDGLVDPYDKVAMGVCAEACAEEYEISRERQDAFAIESYKRTSAAWEAGKMDKEIVPVEIPQRRGEPVIFDKDEEYTAVNFDKIPKLRTVFKKEGTVTAANASTINDGAAAVVMCSRAKAEELGLPMLAEIVSYADASQEPKWFTTAPAKALPKALEKAGLSTADIDAFELNEAFSVVGLANMDILKLDESKVNVHGGAVSVGHPLGASGTRIIMALINVLEENNGSLGAAGICNGGGGASALVLKKL